MISQNENLPVVQRVQSSLGAMQKQFKSTLPAHISPQKFLRAAVTAVQNTPDLQEAEVPSIISACQKAATDGLIIDGREAALVVFNKKVNNKWEKHAQYMPMVAGILKKARNSGQISAISAHVVYMNDEFSYELGLEPKLVHKPIIDGEPGELRCCYAIAKLKGASIPQFEVMTKSQIYKIMMSSKSGWDDKKNQPKGIWLKWEDEMWRKTVLKRLAKYLPSSSDLDGIIEYDNAEFGINLDTDDPVKPETANKAPAKKKATRAAAAILNKKPAAAEKPADEIEDGVIIIEGEAAVIDDAPAYDGADDSALDDLI